MKPFIWLSFVLLGGCVMYDARHFEFTHLTYAVDSKTDASQFTSTPQQPSPVPKTQVIIRTVTAPKSSAPSEVAANGAQIKSNCKPFVLPSPNPQPLSPALTDTKMTPDQMDAAVAQYVKDLRGYIKSERESLEASYSAWLDSCK